MPDGVQMTGRLLNRQQDCQRHHCQCRRYLHLHDHRKNGNKATAAWKNVMMTDAPIGVKLVVGGVYVNNEFALYHLSGNVCAVWPLWVISNRSESAEITFDVQVTGEEMQLEQRLPIRLRLTAITVWHCNVDGV